MSTIVVQDDKILRFLQVILDPEVTPTRINAFHDYLAFDIPNPDAWFEEQRKRAANIYPSSVRMVENEEQMRANLSKADAVVSESFSIGADEITAGEKLRLIQKFGVDTRNIDLNACRDANIPVRVLRRRVNGAVAEHAIMLMLVVGRKMIETDGALDFKSLQALGYRPAKFDPDHVAGANWARIDGLRSLQGATLGALGMGEIGREVATRARAMGMDILYYQRSRLPESIESYCAATYVSYEELLERSDFVSIHLPLNRSTEGMLNADAFNRMKPGTIVTNISRAHIIDRMALVSALDSGHLGGAGLDVHFEEPGAPDEPLKKYPNVVLSPHIAVAQRLHNLADMEELVGNLVESLAN